jgi:hypothetical protein
MLAYILAVLVGAGSVGLYAAAFFLPEIHRKNDFIWSGVGLFYALFLWIYAHQVTGGILVGQTSSVLLMGWFAWQIVKMRRQLVAVERQAAIANPTRATEPEVNRSVSTAAKPTSKTPTPPKSTPQSVTPTTAKTPSVAPTSTAPASTTSSRQSKPPASAQIPLSEVKIPPAQQPVVPTSTKVQSQRFAAPPQTPVSQPVAALSNHPNTNQPTQPAVKSESVPNAQLTQPVVKSEPVPNSQQTPPAVKPESVPNTQPIQTAVKSEPSPNRQQTPPAVKPESANEPEIPDSAQPEAEAWIQLELKPSTTKPLGTAVKPPPPTPSTPEAPQSSPIVPETVSQHTPTDATPTTAKVEQSEPDRS